MTCPNDTEITIKNYNDAWNKEYLNAWNKIFNEWEENMFTQLTEKKMEKRKWFIDNIGNLRNLDDFDYFEIEMQEQRFKVVAVSENGEFSSLGYFETKDEAKAYIKEIYDFLVKND